jgi:hypothetical protein
VAVNGREFAVHDGWNRLRLGLRGVQALSVRIAHVVQPPAGEGGAGGIRELRIPGVRATEALRPPLLVEHALHGADLRRAGLTYLFDRTTGDDPLRPKVVTGARSRGLVRDQQDGERGWARAIAPPAARAWARRRMGRRGARDARTTCSTLGGRRRRDGVRRLLALRGRGTQPRLVGVRRRPAAGVDRRLDPLARGVASVAHANAADDRAPAPRTRVRAGSLPDARARRRRRPPHGALAVAADGGVALPAPLRARTVRIEVLDAAFPPGTPGIDRQRRAVGVGEVSGDGVPRAAVAHGGTALRLACGDGPALHLGAQVARLRVAATAAAIDAGRPLRAAACGGRSRCPPRPVTVRADAAPWRLDHVRLSSPAAASTPVAGGGRVIDPGATGAAPATACAWR